eukprot:GHVP01040033.1.p1 GENE.GHVP01040033.1~~GHVP01040033.1.p1  ORF type:complete len:644 (+),score=135.28 GHVP01040033.1:67-1998(+)
MNIISILRIMLMQYIYSNNPLVSCSDDVGRIEENVNINGISNEENKGETFHNENGDLCLNLLTEDGNTNENENEYSLDNADDNLTPPADSEENIELRSTEVEKEVSDIIMNTNQAPDEEETGSNSENVLENAEIDPSFVEESYINISDAAGNIEEAENEEINDSNNAANNVEFFFPFADAEIEENIKIDRTPIPFTQTENEALVGDEKVKENEQNEVVVEGEGKMLGSQREELVSGGHSEEPVQSEEQIANGQSEESIANGQSEEQIANGQSEESIANNQSEEYVFPFSSEEPISNGQNEHYVFPFADEEDQNKDGMSPEINILEISPKIDNLENEYDIIRQASSTEASPKIDNLENEYDIIRQASSTEVSPKIDNLENEYDIIRQASSTEASPKIDNLENEYDVIPQASNMDTNSQDDDLENDAVSRTRDLIYEDGADYYMDDLSSTDLDDPDELVILQNTITETVVHTIFIPRTLTNYNTVVLSTTKSIGVVEKTTYYSQRTRTLTSLLTETVQSFLPISETRYHSITTKTTETTTLPPIIRKTTEYVPTTETSTIRVTTSDTFFILRTTTLTMVENEETEKYIFIRKTATKTEVENISILSYLTTTKTMVETGYLENTLYVTTTMANSDIPIITVKITTT